MLEIKSPEKYINQPGIIKTAGEYLKSYGSKALIIGSKTAIQVVGDDLYNTLADHKIEYIVEEFSGYPTIEKARQYAKKAQEIKAGFIIGVGGGKVQDISKATGTFSELPVAAIPTIAATCASWAAVSIIYTEEGDFEQFLQNQHSPKIIIADTEVIMKAPERYIKAGIVDTLAKWYETAPGLKGENDSLALQISVHGAKLAYDLLEEKALKALEEREQGIVGKNATDVVDAIIYLAGFVGSFVGARAYSGFAHPFYHSSRRIASSRFRLHGELVAFGLLAQLILEGKTEEEVRNTVERFSKLDEAFTLQDLGLEENKEVNLDIIANRVLDQFPDFKKLGFGANVELIKQAFDKADTYVREFQEKNKRS